MLNWSNHSTVILNWRDGNLPPGSIVDFTGKSAPKGTFRCNILTGEYERFTGKVVNDELETETGQLTPPLSVNFRTASQDPGKEGK